ncbi:hypothetical protein [Allostella humosa]|uniref:hypothetical protein n=1 Tax=Stella humosa TaxID=94 RepID=UPI001153214B|nr:hypothetical protein [Stella humosa]
MTAGLLTLGPVVSLAVARAARGLPPAAADASIGIGDRVRLRRPGMRPVAATIARRLAGGGLVVTLSDDGSDLTVRRDQVERLAPLARGDRVQHLPTGQYGTVTGGCWMALQVAFDADGLAPATVAALRVDLHPCAGPWHGTDPTPPEAA